MPRKNQPESVGLSATLTIPELEQSKAAVLNTLASQHSRRSYEYAIERFIAWYCSEPRLTFNVQPICRGEVSRIPRTPLAVRSYDQLTSFRDSEVGR
jgi:hypothetical protein